MQPNIGDVGRYAIFLDLDGTLVELADHPDAVRVHGATLRALEALGEKTGQALAVVSGREIAVIDRLLHPLRLPIAGVHGRQRRDAAGSMHRSETQNVTPITLMLEKAIGDKPGVIIERKPGAVALHYRMRPDLEQCCRELAEEAVGQCSDLRLLHGKMVLEIISAGADKGSVIRTFLSEPPFSGRLPIFAGDDVTDEAGFAVVNALGGISIKIGDQETGAQFRFKDVSQFHSWLCKLAEDCEAPRP